MKYLPVSLDFAVLRDRAKLLDRDSLLMATALLEEIINSDFRRAGLHNPLENRPPEEALSALTDASLLAWCEALASLLLLKRGRTIEILPIESLADKWPDTAERERITMEETPEEMYNEALHLMEQSANDLINFARAIQGQRAEHDLAGGRELALAITNWQQAGHWLADAIHEFEVAWAAKAAQSE